MNGNVDILISEAELALFPLAGSSKLRGRGFLPPHQTCNQPSRIGLLTIMLEEEEEGKSDRETAKVAKVAAVL